MKKIQPSLTSRFSLTLRTLLLVAVFICVCIQGYATTVTIGTGTSTQRYPYAYYFGYTRSAAIYTSTEVGNTASNVSITSIGYYCTNAANTGPTVVYMRATGTTTAETSTTWATKISGATTVYTSATPGVGTAGTYRTITLTTPFSLTSGQNLEIMVECNYTGTGTGATAGNAIRYTTATNAHQYWEQDNSAPTGSGTVTSNRPNVQLVYTACTPPTITTQPSTGTQALCVGGSSTALTVATSASSPTYQWYSNTTASNSGGTLLSGATSSSYSPSTATAGTLYYYCIVTAASCPATSGVSGAITTTAYPGLATTPSPATGATGVCYSGTGPVTSVSWTAVSGATSYDVYFGAGSLPGPVTSNVATASYTTGTLLPNTTYYWMIVPKNSCGATTGSPATWTFTTSGTPCYCTPTGSTNTATYISNFTTTGCTTNINNSSGYSTGGYGNYSPTVIATQSAGSSIGYSITTVGGTAGLAIWVDWNQNGVFTDAGENVYNSAAYLATGTYTGSFTVPTGAASGNTRIRIITNYNATSPAPCVAATTARGEAEDYGLNICTPVTITGQSTATQTICKGGSLAALTVSSSTATSYQWYSNTTASNTGGTAVTTGTGGTTSSYTPSTSVGSSLYYYCVVGSSCSSATSAVSGLITVTAPFTPSAITGTTTICAGTTSTLSSALPSGGTISTSGTYPNSSYVQTFTSSGSLVVPSGMTDLNADILAVAGGGGGGSNGGGGGGGGGVSYAPSTPIPAGSTTVTVGTGGAAAVTSSVAGSNGNNSSVGSLVTAIGGGGGGSRDGGAGGQNGGSGGGGGGAGSATGSCNPGTYSGSKSDGGYYDVGSAGSITINCLPAGATITSVHMDISIDSYCAYDYYSLAYSYDNINYYYYPGAECGGTFTETLWNGLTNGAKIYIAPVDEDGYTDHATISINAGTTVYYSTLLHTDTAGKGTVNQGNNGAIGTASDAGCNAAGGGGGGAGGLGTAGSGSGVNSVGGNGGAGIANSITGTSVTYGGGGGGGATGYIGCGTVTNIVNGTGGTGGGSNGESGTPGTANTGGGGGAETAGGSGVVILKYPGGKWTTSDPTVATVDQAGVVTGVAAGTATITYTVAIGTCTNQVSTVVTVLGAAANVQLATSSVNAVTLTEQCTDGAGWSYYADPATPNSWLFGVYKNGNTFTPSVNLTVNASPTETRNDAAKKASYTMDRYWNVTIAGSISPSQPVKVRFFYSPSDTAAMRSAAVSRASAYGLSTSRINGIEWFKTTAGIAFDPGNNTPVDVPNKMLPTVAYGTLNGVSYVDYQGLVSFSGGTAGMRLSPSGAALPVQLLYVTATPEADSYIRLDWATATEINNKGFEIERSTDGVTYESIGWIDGHDNSNSKTEYSYDDKTVVPNSIYYYRLRQIDMDGKSDLSNIVSATILGKNGFVVESLRPNPASDKVTVQVVSIADQSATVSVTDLLGRELSSQDWHIATGFNGTDIDLSSLASGPYNVVVKTQNQYFTKKLIVKR